MRDRNRITGGGVTAGIDFGLALLHELFGERTPRLVQLLMEYDPSPPFDAGTPERAGEDLVEVAMPLMARVAQETMDVAGRLLAGDPRQAGSAI